MLSDNKSNKINKSGNWIGFGTALGLAVFAATNEPTWIVVGIAIGAAIRWQKPKYKK